MLNVGNATKSVEYGLSDVTKNSSLMTINLGSPQMILQHIH